jgi:hypothetical protein
MKNNCIESILESILDEIALEQQALQEQEAMLKKETLAEQEQKCDDHDHHDGNSPKPQLVRLDSIQEMVTLEDMVLQHEEEVKKLESLVTQQSARQNARLEERLLHRRHARQRQLKQAKVDRKNIKREAKKLKKMDEAARAKAEQENEAVTRELLQTAQMAAEAPEVLTARAFKTLLEESRAGGEGGMGTNAVAGLEGGEESVAGLGGPLSAEQELVALERAKQQAVELEQRRQEALLAARKEHAQEMLLLESQLKEEAALQESQLRARLAKRHAEKQRKTLAFDVRGPALSAGGKGGVVKLEPLNYAKKMQEDAKAADLEFENEVVKLRSECAKKGERMVQEQKARLEEEETRAKVQLEAEAAHKVEEAKRKQAELAEGLQKMRDAHKEEIGHLRSEMDAQQRRVDERLQSRLAKRKLSLAVQQSQPDVARLTSGPIRDSWTGGMEEETDPDVLDIKRQIADLNRKLHAKREEHLERERAQKCMVDSARAEALAATSALNTFKEKLCIDEQRKSQRLVRQGSSGLRLADVESMPNTPRPERANGGGDAALVPPGMVISDDTTQSVVPKPRPPTRADSTGVTMQRMNSRPTEPPKTFRNALKMLVQFEQHKFSEDECLVLEEFARMARKNVGKKSSQALNLTLN